MKKKLKQRISHKKKIIFSCSLVLGAIFFAMALLMFSADNAYAASPEISINTDRDGVVKDAMEDAKSTFSLYYDNGEGGMATSVRILIVLTVLSLVPSILIMLTSFTRIVVVLHFVRAAMGTQTSPPNQVLVGLALFLTLFIMSPVMTRINEDAIKPLDAGDITQEQAFEAAAQPIREFMYGQTKVKDIDMFCDIAGITYEDKDEIPLTVLIPSFMVSELRTAFIIGFLIYIPFIVIDMVVSSVLMSMGMMMLPPTTISMPFKILLFVLADGWNLVIGSLVKTFY